MSSRQRILLLGGTREAAELARTLVAEGHDVTTSLAGRTKEPRPVAGSVRMGGFGGTEGLADWLRAHRIERLIDATHPFAETISRNAVLAGAMAGVPVERIERPPWDRCPGDDWREAPHIAAAVDLLPAGATVLLALGSQHIAPFARRDDVTFVVRMVDRPAQPLPLRRHRLVLARPSPDPNEEADLLRREAIGWIVCRNSGGPGAYAKIEAARRLGLPVVMIARPAAR